jgi:hypothetical protein
MPELNKVHESYKGQGLVLIGIHCDPDVAKRNSTVKAKGVKYAVCQAKAEETPEAYRIDGYPTVFVIDRKGIIRAVDPPDLGKAVKEALAAK